MDGGRADDLRDMVPFGHPLLEQCMLLEERDNLVSHVQRKTPQTKGGRHINSFDMLATLGVNTSAPVSVTQTLVDCSKEDVQRELQKRKQYEPNMLEGPTQREPTRHCPPGGLCTVWAPNKAEWCVLLPIYLSVQTQYIVLSNHRGRLRRDQSKLCHV
ncbi:hypothetical protein BJY52DRAFT_1284916 [Lactarius psammicola]|nr:hypothetical protein BJY52DRAFT_1284916 [Lactarius psammicola]